MQREGKILTYKEVTAIPSSENGERLVEVRKYDPEIIAKYEKTDMLPYTGGKIFVRDTVAKKLAAANGILLKQSGLRLKVVYGYRHPEVQELYFNERQKELTKTHGDLSKEDFDSLTHNFVAVPSVAGHPTGGAIDITIADGESNSIEMGTGIADFSDAEKIKTFATDLSDTQINNRRLLHDILVREDFAPFYGEWWHFSYGDKEWACFYEELSSLYSPIDFKI